MELREEIVPINTNITSSSAGILVIEAIFHSWLPGPEIASV